MAHEAFPGQLNALLKSLEALRDRIDGLPSEERETFDPALLNVLAQAQRLSLLGHSELQQQLQAERHTRDQVETELYEAQETLRLMLESMKDHAVLTLDLDGRVTSWNAGAERIFGYAVDEVIGESGAILFTPEDRLLRLPELELGQSLEHGFAEDERWHMRKDGSRFFVSGVMRQMRDRAGNLRGFIKVARDITERKRAEVAERERRILAEALRDTAMILSSSLELNEVLDQILISVGRVVEHDAAYLLLIENGMISHTHTRGLSAREQAVCDEWVRQRQLSAAEHSPFQGLLGLKTPLVIPDVQTIAGGQTPLFDNIRSMLNVPIIVDEEEIGLLSLTSSTPNFFRVEHGETLEAFSYQAALAIRNAQMFFQSQELAAMQERQQLARDLHDAVSQTLFTASVLTESLPRQWAQNPERVPQTLSSLNLLTKGALAEMRTLLLQLRPNNLQTARMSDLLRYLLEAIQGRQTVETSLVVEGEVSLPPDAHLAIYRIAQEALNNISKHARATQIAVTMRGGEGRIELEIRDNGRGFSSETDSSGLGMQIMRERADDIAAALEIRSQPGDGTVISVRWPTIRPPSLRTHSAD